jgi:hypothetical protein
MNCSGRYVGHMFLTWILHPRIEWLRDSVAFLETKE